MKYAVHFYNHIEILQCISLPLFHFKVKRREEENQIFIVAIHGHVLYMYLYMTCFFIQPSYIFCHRLHVRVCVCGITDGGSL